MDKSLSHGQCHAAGITGPFKKRIEKVIWKKAIVIKYEMTKSTISHKPDSVVP